MYNNSHGKSEREAFIQSLVDSVHGKGFEGSNNPEIKKQIKLELEKLNEKINPNIEQFYFFTQKIRDTYKADDISAIERTKQYCLDMIEKAGETKEAFLVGGWILKFQADNLVNMFSGMDDDKIKLDLLLSHIRIGTNGPQRILPVHLGYQKICIILEKEKDFSQALYYANKAASEGWLPDWTTRIEKLQKKIGTTKT